MTTPGLLSIILPSRNEKYLQKTIQDLLAKAQGNIEIKAILDGWWPTAEELVEDPRVSYIHFSTPRGMRGGINAGVAVSKGEYLMKLDAHCMVSQGFDKALKDDCADNWVVVPRRYALDPEKWAIIDNPKYPVDYMYLSSQLHGVIWKEKNADPELKNKLIDETMSNQGSVWFMKRTYFDWLELMDEKDYGVFWNEFQEVGLKCWLSGGRVIINKNAWYAHWHKTSSDGRGYHLETADHLKAEAHVQKWLTQKNWHKQDRKLKWLVRRFAPVPTWPARI
jgi:glycosyltransferase involved in cell wall biosynthesis